MKTAAGKTIQNGIAIGPLRVCRREATQLCRTSALTPEEEWTRFTAACGEARAQLAELYGKALDRAGRDSAAIFEIHQMLLEDDDYLEAVRDLLETQGVSAAYAAIAAGERFAALFSAMEDSYMRSRAADIEDVSRRVADILTGRGEPLPQEGPPAILAAGSLTPGEAMALDRSRLLGLVTRRGSENSHTAILARAMGIPALTGVDFDEGWDGRPAVLDGERGCLCIDPDPDFLDAVRARQTDALRQADRLRALRDLPSVTLDGREIRIYANAGSVQDAAMALDNGAQGIGLFRSEMLCLASGSIPGEEQQFAVYRQVVETMAGRRTVIRTLDAGADKHLPGLCGDKEENPALGCRGIRASLTRQDLFRQQLRAVLRAAAFGPVAVMFPMIASLWEVREAKALLEACRAELEAQGVAAGPVEVGIMVETPAAVVMAEELAEEADFFSIGTNDLTQYTLAADRQNPGLERFCDPRHPAVLRMIRHTAEAAHRHGCQVGICGELGADPALAEDFLRMGLDSLSVAPSAVLPLREHIRSLDLSRDAKPASQ